MYLWTVVSVPQCILGNRICHVAEVKENALCVCFADVMVRLQAQPQRHRPALHLRNPKQLDVKGRQRERVMWHGLAKNEKINKLIKILPVVHGVEGSSICYSPLGTLIVPSLLKFLKALNQPINQLHGFLSLWNLSSKEVGCEVRGQKAAHAPLYNEEKRAWTLTLKKHLPFTCPV